MDNRGGTFNTGDYVNQNNSGNNVNQEINVDYNFPEEAFSNLLDQIHKIKDERLRQEAEYFAEELRKALKKGDKSTVQRLLGFLKNRVHDTAALITIASSMGIVNF